MIQMRFRNGLCFKKGYTIIHITNDECVVVKERVRHRCRKWIHYKGERHAPLY